MTTVLLLIAAGLFAVWIISQWNRKFDSLDEMEAQHLLIALGIGLLYAGLFLYGMYS